MKFLYLSIILLSCTNSIIVNNKKICKNCKYYKADTKQCRFFYETDLVTGKKTYEYASLMRKQDDKCSINANFFKINNFKFITVPYYFFKDYWLPSMLIIIISLYIYADLFLLNKLSK